jgi:adenylate cyclase
VSAPEFREIERKFRVLIEPSEWPLELIGPSAVDIRQGYMTPAGRSPEIRLREAREISFETAHLSVPRSLTGAHGTNVVRKLCVKGPARDGPGSALDRVEVEFDLTAEVFNEYWRLTNGRRLRKRRISYAFRADDSQVLAVIVDRFADTLGGLLLAEVEFADARSAAAFEPPVFFGTEVTQDPRYRNSSLAEATGPPPEPIA